MRDVVFFAAVEDAGAAFGPRRPTTPSLAILVVFCWLGCGTAWAGTRAFGAAHALGVVINHYFTIMRKNVWERGFVAYNRSRNIQAVAVTLTFSYVTASLFLIHGSTLVVRNMKRYFHRIPSWQTEIGSP